MNVILRQKQLFWFKRSLFSARVLAPVFNENSQVSGIRQKSDGIVQTIFSPENPLVSGGMSALTFMHDITGLPWWSTIIIASAIVRSLVIFPLSFYQQLMLRRIEKLHPEMNAIAAQLRNELDLVARTKGWPPAQLKRTFLMQMKRRVRTLYERDNCHPMKNIAVIYFQFPIWIVMSAALRNLSGGAGIEFMQPAMSQEGILWFSNLLLQDTTLLLPLALLVINAVNIELSLAGRPSAPGRSMMRFAPLIYQGTALILLPIAASVPSSMAWYWVISGSIGLIQNLIFVSPTFRRRLGFQNVSSHPIQEHIKRRKDGFKRLGAKLRFYLT